MAEPEAEQEGIGRLGFWSLGAAAGFFLTFWVGLIVLLSMSGPDTSGAAVTPGSGGDSPPSSTDAVTVTATEFALDPVPPQLASGELTFVLRNEGAVFHNLEILTQGGELVSNFLLEADSNEEDTGSTTLPAGGYLLICSVPGHREAGMEATLTITG
ncbi:MAG: hypothetical protein ACE5MI_13745 [Acidimicrobiia bacterium]